MRLSFYDYSFINPEWQKFVGLDNYIRLFQDSAFLDALKHTFILAFVVVAFISVLAFIIAVLLEGNIRGNADEFKQLHEYYTTRPNNPLKKMQSLIVIACKILRVIHTILKTGTTYDPQKQLKDIKRPVEAQAPMAA